MSGSSACCAKNISRENAKSRPQQLREFCDSYFGEHGGYAQQYLFHHARKTTPRRKRKSPAELDCLAGMRDAPLQGPDSE